MLDICCVDLVGRPGDSYHRSAAWWLAKYIQPHLCGVHLIPLKHWCNLNPMYMSPFWHSSMRSSVQSHSSDFLHKCPKATRTGLLVLAVMQATCLYSPPLVYNISRACLNAGNIFARAPSASTLRGVTQGISLLLPLPSAVFPKVHRNPLEGSDIVRLQNDNAWSQPALLI